MKILTSHSTLTFTKLARQSHFEGRCQLEEVPNPEVNAMSHAVHLSIVAGEIHLLWVLINGYHWNRKAKVL